jgi:lactoylglutathione lyase
MDESTPSLGPPVLFISDVQRSKDFYCDNLGFTVLFEDENSAGLGLGHDMIMLLDPIAAQDLLTGQSTETPKSHGSMGVFNFFVDNVDEWFTRLSGAGVEFIIEPVDRAWGRRTSHFKDPDGIVWEVSQSIE